MTPRIAWLVLLSLAVGLAYAPQGHGAVPPLALDGVGTCAGGVGCPIQLLTTTKGHDVIVLIVECFCNNEISAIIDSNGLTFAQRLSYASELPCFEFPCAGFSARIWEFYARSSSPLRNDNITVVANNCCEGTAVLAIHGANARAIFDQNPSIPAKVTCPSLACGDCYGVGNPTPCVASIETSAIDFVIATTAINDAPPCGLGYRRGVVPGFSNITAGSDFEVDYAITTVAPSNVVFQCQGTDVVAIVVDAVSFLGALGASG